MIIDDTFVSQLFEKAEKSPRKRMHHDLRTSEEDGSQRMMNALLPGTQVPIHRHPHSSESFICLKGNMDAILYDDNGNEMARYKLHPAEGIFGCNVPEGFWHSVEVYEPSLVFEAKDIKYGQDGSETYDDFIAKNNNK